MYTHTHLSFHAFSSHDNVLFGKNSNVLKVNFGEDFVQVLSLSLTFVHLPFPRSNTYIFTEIRCAVLSRSSITRSSLINRCIKVKLISVKLDRSVVYVYNKIIVIPCILWILETAEFNEQFIFARNVKFQIDDVMSAHWPVHYRKTRIITNTLILQKWRKIPCDFNDIILKI